MTPSRVSRLDQTAASCFLDPQAGWVDVPGTDPTTGGTLCRTTGGSDLEGLDPLTRAVARFAGSLGA